MSAPHQQQSPRNNSINEPSMTTSSNLFFLLLATLAAVAVCAASPIVTLELEDNSNNCPWRTVANVDSPDVQGYGAFALRHVVLAFVKVESARAQAVGDCGNNLKRNYELVIDATQRPGGEVFKYRAVVYVEYGKPVKLISLDSIVKPRPPLAN